LFYFQAYAICFTPNVLCRLFTNFWGVLKPFKDVRVVLGAASQLLEAAQGNTHPTDLWTFWKLFTLCFCTCTCRS